MKNILLPAVVLITLAFYFSSCKCNKTASNGPASDSTFKKIKSVTLNVPFDSLKNFMITHITNSPTQKTEGLRVSIADLEALINAIKEDSTRQSDSVRILVGYILVGDDPSDALLMQNGNNPPVYVSSCPCPSSCCPPAKLPNIGVPSLQ